MASRPRRRGREPAKTTEDQTFTGAFPKLQALTASVKKEFGGDYTGMANVVGRRDTYLETGILSVDLALMGGLPENKISMFAGWEGSGKSTLALRVCAAAQRKYPDKAAAWIDMERSLDPVWAEKHEVYPDRFYNAQPPKGEQAVDIVQGLMASGEVSVIVIDSLPSLVPASTADGSAFDKQMADRARLIGVLTSKINVGLADHVAAKTKCTVIFINQFRSTMGGIPGRGPTKQLSGGAQPRYYSSVILELYAKEEQGGDADSSMKVAQYNTHMFRVKKARTGNSLKEGEWDMVRDPGHPLGEGAIDDYVATLAFAKRFGLFNGVGSKQSFVEDVGIDRTFKNKDEAVAYLQANRPEYIDLKRLTVAAWRTRSGMPALPPDGYLMGFPR